MGFAQPANTGTSCRPAISHICRALRCVKLERDIPADGCNTEQIEFVLRGESEEKCDGIILTRIAVDDNPACHDLRTSA